MEGTVSVAHVISLIGFAVFDCVCESARNSHAAFACVFVYINVSKQAILQSHIYTQTHTHTGTILYRKRISAHNTNNINDTIEYKKNPGPLRANWT